MSTTADISREQILQILNQRGVEVSEPVIELPPAPTFRELLGGILDGLRPEPALTVTQWADTYRMLSSKASAEPGKYRSSRTPYAVEVMDALSPSAGYKFVVSMKGAQIGFSEIGFNWLGYCIDQAPGPFLLVNPTDETMVDNSKLRIAPMIEETPVLQAKISAPKSRGSENALKFKSFPGGVLRMVGSNSAAGLRSMPTRYLMLDEIDGYPNDVDKEGDPLQLAIKRTDTFGARAKILMISTPTNADSKIAAEFAKTDQRHFHVPCPHCGDFEPIVWDNIHWKKNGETYTAWLACTACGSMIDERHKTWMLANGQWVAHRPDLASPERVGFHLSGLYSPLGMFSWADAARQYEQAYVIKNQATLKQVFRNTVLGLVYEEDQERPPWAALMDRAGEYKRNHLPEFTPEAAPGKPMFLTCGIDKQRDRLELQIVAWGMGREWWVVDYRVIPGDTSTLSDPCWDALEALHRETWNVSGVRMEIARSGLDSGDDTLIVYQAVHRMNNKGVRIMAVKGQDHQLTAIAKGGKPNLDAQGTKKGRDWYNVGVSALKDELYGYLHLEKSVDGSCPAGYGHFPDFGDAYFQGLTAEAKQTKMETNGHLKSRWVKVHPRNEPLDCWVYARAVASFAGMIDFDVQQMNQLRGVLGSMAMAGPREAKPEKKPKRKPREGSIWG